MWVAARVSASSGDSGATDFVTDGSANYPFPVNSWPSSDPLVTSIGGTIGPEGNLLEPTLGSGRFAALYLTALLWGASFLFMRVAAPQFGTKPSATVVVPGATATVPVRYQGELLGALSVFADPLLVLSLVAILIGIKVAVLYVLGTFFWHIDGVFLDIPLPKAGLLSARQLSATFSA